MVQLTYYDDRGPEWEWWRRAEITLPEDRSMIEVRHGYTLDNIDHLTRRALIRCYGLGLALSDRYMVAYGGIVIALMEADHVPDESDLVLAGQKAIGSASTSEYQNRGLTHTEAKPSPRFVAYWHTIAGPTEPAVERVDDRIALGQILQHLTEPQREVLAVFAATGQRSTTAEVLGLSEKAANSRILAARQAAVALWHDHETPAPLPRDRRRGSGKKPAETHCKRGHAYTAENTITSWSRSSRRPVRRCRTCRDARNAKGAARRRADRESVQRGGEPHGR